MAANRTQKAARSPNRFQDRTGKWAFGVFAAVGLLVIVAIEATSSPKLFSMSVCASLMLLYAGLTYFIPSMRARADQIGDNVYYLGLLYTLLSLAAAIVRLADDPNAADAILRNFGIALITTILGITLRVIISQMRDDPVDIERETRATLLESTRRFREELEQSAIEMRMFHLSLRQRVEESVEQSLVQLKAGFKEAEKLEGAIASIVASLNRTAQAADALNRSIEGMANGFSKVDVLDERLMRLAASVEEADKSVGSMQQSFRGLGQSLGEGIGASISDALANNSKVTNDAVKSLQDLREAARDLESLSKSLAKLGQTFRTELGDSHEAIAKVRDEMADLAGYVLKRLEA